MMKRLSIEFRSRTFRLTEFLRERALSVLESNLGPHRERLGRVVIRFSDENGPRGGADDKVCAIQMELVGHGTIQAQSRAADVRSALMGAVGRSRVLLDRAVQRERSFVRVVA